MLSLEFDFGRVWESWRMAAGTLLIVLFATVIGNAIHNYYRNDLSRFPGPRLAAMTSFYQTYIEVITDSCFIQKLEELHAVYGEAMRFNDFQSPKINNLCSLRERRSNGS